MGVDGARGCGEGKWVNELGGLSLHTLEVGTPPFLIKMLVNLLDNDFLPLLKYW